MNTMKRSMIGLCAVFACVGIANADTETDGESTPSEIVGELGNSDGETSLTPDEDFGGSITSESEPTEEVALALTELEINQAIVEAGPIAPITADDIVAAETKKSIGVINATPGDIVAAYATIESSIRSVTADDIAAAEAKKAEGLVLAVTADDIAAAEVKKAGGIITAVTTDQFNDAKDLVMSAVKRVHTGSEIVSAKVAVNAALKIDVFTNSDGTIHQENVNTANVDTVLIDSTQNLKVVEYYFDIVSNAEAGIETPAILYYTSSEFDDDGVLIAGAGAQTLTLTLTQDERTNWLNAYYAKSLLANQPILDAGFNSDADLSAFIKAQMIVSGGVKGLLIQQTINAAQTSVATVLNDVTNYTIDIALADSVILKIIGDKRIVDEGVVEGFDVADVLAAQTAIDDGEGTDEDQFIVDEGVVAGKDIADIRQARIDIDSALAAGETYADFLEAYETASSEEVEEEDVVTAQEVKDAQAIVDAALVSVITLEKILAAKAIVDGEGFTPAEIAAAEAVLDIDYKDGFTQEEIDAALTTAAGGVIEGVTPEDIAAAQKTIDDGVIEGVTPEDIAAAQKTIDDGIIEGVTPDQIAEAQALIAKNLVEGVTAAQIAEAQAIIDKGIVEGVTAEDITEAEELIAAGFVVGVTAEDIAEAEELIAKGIIEEVTQEQVDIAQAFVTAASITPEEAAAVEAVVNPDVIATQEQIDAAKALVDAGKSTVTQEQIDAKQEALNVVRKEMSVLVNSGASIENPTAEEIQAAQDKKAEYVATYGVDVVRDAIDIYTIDGNDVDAFMVITNSSNDEDIVHDKKFVSHGGIDAVKALVNTGDVETALGVLFQLDDETLTVKDFIVKSSPDVTSSASGSTAGVNVVGGAIGGHQQSSVASSGKYGLKKHSLSVSKQLGVSSGGEGRDTGAWMEVFGSASEMDMRDSVPGYNADSSGIVVGVDKTIGNMMIGAAISVADIDVDGKSSADSRTDSDQYQGTLYGTLMMDSFYVNGSVAYAHASNDTSRTGLAGAVTGSYGTDIYAASLGIGIPVDLGNSAIIPQATLSYASISPDAYTESGVGALHVDIEDMESFGIKAGVAVINTIVIDGGIIAPKLRLMADWDISREKAVVNSSWVGDVDNTIYSTTGARPASLGAVMGAGVDYASDDGLYVLSLDYDLSTRSNFVSHAGSAKLRVNF